MCFHLFTSVVQCPPLTAPDNGMISCTGNEVGDTCTISCDDGYELGGSETRTCQGDGSWSGTDATCSAGIQITLDTIFIIIEFIISTIITCVISISLPD